MVGLVSLKSCYDRPKMRNSVLGLEGLRVKKKEVGRLPVGCVSYSVFKGKPRTDPLGTP